jgi:hypothetical protein
MTRSARSIPTSLRWRTSLALLAALVAALVVTARATAAAPNILLDFSAPVPGTVVDKAGQGTGFTGTMGNTTLLSPNLSLGGGLLSVTTTGGSALPPNPASQANALAVSFDGSSGSYAVQTSIVPGSPWLTTPFQDAGIFVGPNSGSYVKLVAQQSASGSRIEMYRAPDPVTAGKHYADPTVGTASRIDLILQVNTVAKVVVGKYALNGGGFHDIGYFPFGDIGTPNDTAGIITSNAQTTQPIVAGYDAFAVVSDPTTDVTAPTIASTTPPANATQVTPSGAAITATFSERMDPTTVTPQTLFLTPVGGGAPVPATVGSGDRITWTLTPAAPLAAGTQYTATVTTQARDRHGNPLASPATWTFTTAGAGQTGSPGGVVTGPSKTGLKLKLKWPKRVTAGKLAVLSLRFAKSPGGSIVTVEQKVTKNRYKALLKRLVTKKATTLKVALGTKPGQVTLRVSYKDGPVLRVTKPFVITVVRVQKGHR